MTPATTDPLAFLIITSSGATEDSIYPPVEEPAAEAKPAPAIIERRPHPRSIEPQPQPVLRLVG